MILLDKEDLLYGNLYLPQQRADFRNCLFLKSNKTIPKQENCTWRKNQNK
jgi:hypothetical protein